MKARLTLDQRINGALVGAAIGAELGFARCMRAERYVVRKPSDIWKLKPEPLKDWKPWLHRVDFGPTRFLVDAGVEAYATAGRRVTPEHFGRV